jgi:hypothetical protein
MISRYGRKFFLASAVLLATCGLRMAGLVGAGELVTLILGTVGVYIAGNVAQKATRLPA